MQENLTVSALTKYLQYKFTQDPYLKNVRVKGEISNFKAHRMGHYYFSLKDQKAVIRCVMFNANKIMNSTYQPKDGDQVVIEGHVDIFAGQGNYQIYAKSLILDGLGQLYEQYELLKQQFEQRGYFSDINKKKLIKFPKVIALLTAREGAAIQDMLSTLKRRYPLANIHIYPTLVQGHQAYKDIIKQLKYVQKIGADVIILGRGGGSIEDLWAFNEPQLIEEMFKCTIPIISAVGHETDYTLSDFVADIRAATPTAAAELVAPDVLNLSEEINNKILILDKGIHYFLNNRQQQFNKIYQNMRLQITSGMTKHYHDNIQFLNDKLQRQLVNKTVTYKYSLEKSSLQLNTIHLFNDIKSNKQRIKLLQEKYEAYVNNKINQQQQQLIHYESQLKALSPIEIMKRGYIIAQDKDTVITSIQQVKVKQLLTLKLHDGTLDVEIKSKDSGEKNG